jgi:uncharacterized membrane protein YciS (DUF1049 family)
MVLPTMLRRLAILVFALSIFVMGGRAEAYKAQQRTKIYQAAAGSLATVPQQPYGPTLQSEEKNHVDADIRVISSPAKDRYDKAAFWISLALAVVGAAGVVAAICTLLFIKAQVIEMRRQRIVMQRTLISIKQQAQHAGDQTAILRDSVKAAQAGADAAKISADIAAGVSVPTLVVHEFETGDVGAADERAFFQCPKIKITVKNYGQTPAFLKWWCLCFSCEQLPEVPIYGGFPGSGVFLERVVIQPGEPYTLPDLLYTDRQMFSAEDVEAIVNRQKVFCAYGYICYGDIFGNTFRRLKFCETVLNIIPGYRGICDWHEGLGPRQYEGIDLFPADEQAQQKTENPN